jgi:HSP90 family molecular chaperone
MQITNESHEVTRSHVFAEGAFQIEANPVMFEILSSRIYTDVPYAIVRELSTNAADAPDLLGVALLHPRLRHRPVSRRHQHRLHGVRF